MTYSFKIDDGQFPYLVKQRGNIKHLKDDRMAWQAAYDEVLDGIFNTLTPWLPADVGSLMDVGSGLGGIDVLLSRHYGDMLGTITLVDGDDDPPEKTLPYGTFSNQKVSKRFLRGNGVNQSLTYLYPEGIDEEPEAARSMCPTQDLIVSFGSWCFHFPPSMYLPFVKSCCREGTILIIDVRKELIEWAADLDGAFTRVGVAHEEEKYQRVVYRS